MSSRAVGWVAVLLAAVPVSVPAQDSLQALVAMEARLDSLRRAAVLADSAAFHSAKSDTVAVGNLRIVTSAALRPLAEAAATEAWDSLSARFGEAALASVALPVIRLGGPGTVIPTTDVHEVARGFLHAGDVLWRTRDPALIAWLAGRLPNGPPDAEAYSLLASEIAWWPGLPNGPCLEGGVAACAVGLDLAVHTDSIDAWYAPAVWPDLVARTVPLAGSDPQRAACTTGGLAACRAVLLRQPLPAPIPVVGRDLLVRIALASGGEGAFARLVADTALPISQRLASASGLSQDELLRRWLAAVRANAPGSPGPTGGELLVALVTCSAALLLVIRGSRWA